MTDELDELDDTVESGADMGERPDEPVFEDED